MHLQIQKQFKNARVLWTDGTIHYLATGMHIFRIDSHTWHQEWIATLGSLAERCIAQFRWSRQLLRLGIHHLWPLSDGGLLVVVRKKAMRVSPEGNASIALAFPRGNKPAHKGVCVTPKGSIFLGEYAMNMDRRLPVVLYRSLDNGNTFQSILEFEPGKVRHIHFVQWDPLAHCLWLGTGDADHECLIFRSTDNGNSWEQVGGGSQLWRAVGISFRSEALYWGTDAGSDAGTHPNFVMRLARTTLHLEKVLELQGPCHGNATLRDGTLLVSTGVEGGVNEKDRDAHLWISCDGTNWQELQSYRKDRLPLLLQYGVIRFPQGLHQGQTIAFTTMGLAGAGETAFFAGVKV